VGSVFLQGLQCVCLTRAEEIRLKKCNNNSDCEFWLVLSNHSVQEKQKNKSTFHTFCWFAALLFPLCQHTQNPALKSSASGSWSCSLPCAVPVPSASSTQQPIQPLTSSFLPKPFHPGAPLPCPGPSHEWLNGGCHLKAFQGATSWLHGAF